jgi:hypothetical protein
VVNSDHVKRKLHSLLCDGSTIDKGNWRQHNKIFYQLQRFKTHRPEKARALFNKVIAVLEEFERAVFAN